MVIDCDQHLLETREMWAANMGARHRDVALRIVDDEVGNAWLTWNGERLVLADVTVPGRTAEAGERLAGAKKLLGDGAVSDKPPAWVSAENWPAWRVGRVLLREAEKP